MTMRIRDLREAAGMTQMELASSMGVVQNAVSNWENEVCLPPGTAAAAAGRAAGVQDRRFILSPGYHGRE